MSTNSACDSQCGAYLHPTRYIAHSAWAEEMLKTHDQIQCPGCGLWTIWKPKELFSKQEGEKSD